MSEREKSTTCKSNDWPTKKSQQKKSKQSRRWTQIVSHKTHILVNFLSNEREKYTCENAFAGTLKLQRGYEWRKTHAKQNIIIASYPTGVYILEEEGDREIDGELIN